MFRSSCIWKTGSREKVMLSTRSNGLLRLVISWIFQWMYPGNFVHRRRNNFNRCPSCDISLKFLFFLLEKQVWPYKNQLQWVLSPTFRNKKYEQTRKTADHHEHAMRNTATKPERRKYKLRILSRGNINRRLLPQRKERRRSSQGRGVRTPCIPPLDLLQNKLKKLKLSSAYCLNTIHAMGVCGKSLTNIRKMFRYILPAKLGTYSIIP